MTSTMATIKDCMCPICLCILIEPVTMPCKHSICLPCYRQTVEKANLCCPLCRLRISVWARKSAKAGTLIDSDKWEAIRKAFPVQVQKRLEGKDILDDDDDDSESYETRLRQLMALSKPGEIREEYEAELQKLQHRRQQEAKMEEEASAALIKSLQQEEEREKESMERLKEERDRLDREIAEKLQETFASEDDEAKLVEPEAWTTSSTVSNRGNKLLDQKTVSKNNKGKCKQVKEASSGNLTLATFFSPAPRETGITSPGCGNKAAGKLDVGNCGNADLASHTFPHDVDFPEDSSNIPASEGFFSSRIQLLGHKHPSDGTPVKASIGNPLLEDVAVGCDVASRMNLNLETDRFAAGPSGLGRCSTVISAAVPDLRTHIPTHEIPDGKHARIRQQLKPLAIRSRISSTQPFSYSVNEPSDGSAATGKYESAGMASSKARSLRSSQQAQPSDARERCSSSEEASLLFHRKNCEDFSKAFVESSMSSGDTEFEFQQSLHADMENVDSICKDQRRATSDKLQHPRQKKAKMEEEASAALIRSLQQEEEREKETMERLKEEWDRLNREIAEKLKETFASEDDEDKLLEPEAWTTSSTVSNRGNKLLDQKTVSKNNKGKCKQIKEASSGNLTLAIFFSPVPRETGITSGCGNKAAGKRDVGNCGNADMASHTFPHDVDFPEDSSHIPASEGFFSSKIQLLGHKHPSDDTPVKVPIGNPLLEDPAVGCGVASRMNLNLETSDRFAAGLNVLGRCRTVISGATPDLRTHIPANIAHEIPDGKHARTRQQLQPIEIHIRISSTQPFSYSVNEPSDGSAATGKFESAGMASSKARSLRSSQQAQPSDAGERCSSSEEASLLFHRKNCENFSKAFVESSMSSGDTEFESQQSLHADMENVDSICKDQRRATSDKVKLAVNPASISSRFHKPDCQPTESGDGAKWKCNDKVNAVACADDLCGNYDNSCVSSCHNDMTNSDSDDTTKNDSDDITSSDIEDITKGGNVTCTEFPENQVPSRQQSAYLVSLEKNTKISNVKSKCNSEKENQIGIDCEQYNNVKTDSKIDHKRMLNPTFKVFRMKTHSAKKSKTSTILSPRGKKVQPVVSKMRWCVPNDSQSGLKRGLKTKNNRIVDKSEPGKINREEGLNRFGKRKLTVPSNDEEQIILDDGKQINNIHNDNRQDMVVKESNVIFSKKRKTFKDDSAIDGSSSVRQETSAIDVVDLDQSGMSQEERDYLMAVHFQDMYSRLDKNKISVDRFRGSKDQYRLRRKTSRK